MFTGVPIVLLLLPTFALAMIFMISLSDRKSPSRTARLRMVEPDDRSWFDHEKRQEKYQEKQIARDSRKKRAA